MENKKARGERIRLMNKAERRALAARAKSIEKKRAEARRTARDAEKTEARREKYKSSGRGARSRRGSVFYLFYFAFLILFFVALFFALELVKSKLAAYEESRPYNYADRVMSEYFGKGDAEGLVERSGYGVSPFEKREDVVALVEGFLDAGAECYSVSSGDRTTLRYAVRSGELKFAEFTLKTTGEVDRGGYDVWGLDSIELMIGGTNAINISSPLGGKVFVNGVELTDEYEVSREVYERDPKLPEDVYPEGRAVYEVTRLIGTPTVTATDRYGADVTGRITVTDGVFYDVPHTFCDVTDDVRERAMAAGEALASYMQKDAPFGSVAQYVDPASDLYRDLATSDVRWANEHNGYSIENGEVSEYVIHSPTVYSVRVRFTHVLYNWGGNFENDFDTTFYYRLTEDGRWLIYDSHVN